jgi:hypothetical protein
VIQVQSPGRQGGLHHWQRAGPNAALRLQALRSMNRSTHERSFLGERFRANRSESRTLLRTGRSESPSGSPGTREPDCVHPAFLLDGVGALRCLRSIWWLGMDAGDVLRHRGSRNRYHRPQRIQAESEFLIFLEIKELRGAGL